MKAWLYRNSYNSKKSSLKNWLFAIAINLLKDIYKNKRPDNEELNEAISDDIDISKDNSENNLADYVFNKMLNLSEKEQNILNLRYKSDLKIEEIAIIMKMSNSAVKVSIHRTIKKLQDYCNE